MPPTVSDVVNVVLVTVVVDRVSAPVVWGAGAAERAGQRYHVADATAITASAANTIALRRTVGLLAAVELDLGLLVLGHGRFAVEVVAAAVGQRGDLQAVVVQALDLDAVLVQ